LNLCPSVSQRHRPIEYQFFIGGIRVYAEIAYSQELVLGSRRGTVKAGFNLARPQRLQRVWIQIRLEIIIRKSVRIRFSEEMVE
jgi:hypothetical protein